MSSNSPSQRENQVFLLLTLAIGALTGLAVVAFILLTERLGMRLYPVGSAAWRRVLIPVGGSLGVGYLLFRYFPNATRKRRAADKSRTVRPRRCDYATHCNRKILLHVNYTRERASRSGAKDLRFKLVVALRQCWAAPWITT